MSAELLISYAQNAEDVVLWRGLGHLRDGTYVDVGGYDPDEDSVTRVFYDQGWRGIDVEPVPQLAERFRSRRPGNEIVEAAVSDQDVDEVVLHWFDSTGLSTLDDEYADRHGKAGFDHQRIHVPVLRLDDVLARSALVTDTIHFLKVDVEGAEDQVLRSLDLDTWRPWVIVVEATEPNSTKPTHQSWEPMLLGAGYTFTLFDGLSRFYVSPEHPELITVLSYPACTFDRYTTARQAEVERRLIDLDAALGQANQAAHESATRWRNSAVVYWAEAVSRVQSSEASDARARLEVDRLTRQGVEVKATLRRVRAERNRLRSRVGALRSRVEQMRSRIETLDVQVQQRNATALGRVRRRLGRARSTGA